MWHVQVQELNRWNRNDEYMSRGLPCIITLFWTHNHDISSAEALHYHSPGEEMKKLFTAYFDSGMNPAAAMKYHKDALEMDADFSEQYFADANKNPLPRSVYYWHEQWRQLNLGEYCASVI